MNEVLLYRAILFQFHGLNSKECMPNPFKGSGKVPLTTLTRNNFTAAPCPTAYRRIRTNDDVLDQSISCVECTTMHVCKLQILAGSYVCKYIKTL